MISIGGQIDSRENAAIKKLGECNPEGTVLTYERALRSKNVQYALVFSNRLPSGKMRVFIYILIVRFVNGTSEF